ncbi:MAG: hypothetical protein ACC645_10240 [Pirellulales bacterium]
MRRRSFDGTIRSIGDPLRLVRLVLDAIRGATPFAIELASSAPPLLTPAGGWQRTSTAFSDRNGGGRHPPRRLSGRFRWTPIRPFGRFETDPLNQIGRSSLLLRRVSLSGRFFGPGDMARQQARRLIADDHRAGRRFEANNQADLLLIAPDRIPRKPQAVRMSQRCLAVELGHLIRREDVLSIGNRVVGRPSRFVEGVDNDRSVHGDWFAFLLAIEVDPAAKSTYRGALRSMTDGVRPGCHDLEGHFGADLFARFPGDPST